MFCVFSPLSLVVSLVFHKDLTIISALWVGSNSLFEH